MQPVRFTYRQPTLQLLRKVTSHDHIVKTTNILRINYCEPYRFTAQPIQMGAIREAKEDGGSLSQRSSMRLSKHSRKMSVVSRELKESQKSQEMSILSGSYEEKDENNPPLNPTDSVILD